MTFPLEALSAAVTVRDETWERLGMRWRVRPVEPNHGKPVVGVEFEAAAWDAEVMIWSTGETELSTFRHADDTVINKHYDLAGDADLEVVLDDLVGLLVDGKIPADAIVAKWPEALA